MKISCIIAALNEEKRIANVLKAVTKAPEVSEIIVIDDGSTDKTQEVARSFKGVKVHHHPFNRGKAEAVKNGLELSTGDHIMLLDADLANLTPADISRLIEPHRKERCVTLSFRASIWHPFYLTKLDILSGERVMPRDVLEKTFSIPLHGFLLEARNNAVLLEMKLPFYSVQWPTVRNTSKGEKIHNPVLGIFDVVKMVLYIMENTPHMIQDSFKMHMVNLLIVKQ